MLLHPLQKRVEGAWTDVIPVASQFIAHPLTVNRALRCVVENMDLPKAEQYFSDNLFHLTPFIPLISYITLIVVGKRNKVKRYSCLVPAVPASLQGGYVSKEAQTFRGAGNDPDACNS